MSETEVAPLSRKLTQAGIDRYAVASGDHNPIHIDPAFARTTPLGGTIAHGMLVLATIAEMMTAAFGEAWLRSGKLDVRFRAPARPGDTITAHAQPAGKSEGSSRYKVECVSQSGEVLISGTAEVKP
jgi:3-hydroxybutyryl-CoA dehydratase